MLIRRSLCYTMFTYGILAVCLCGAVNVRAGDDPPITAVLVAKEPLTAVSDVGRVGRAWRLDQTDTGMVLSHVTPIAYHRWARGAGVAADWRQMQPAVLRLPVDGDRWTLYTGGRVSPREFYEDQGGFIAVPGKGEGITVVYAAQHSLTVPYGAERQHHPFVCAAETTVSTTQDGRYTEMQLPVPGVLGERERQQELAPMIPLGMSRTDGDLLLVVTTSGHVLGLRPNDVGKRGYVLPVLGGIVGIANMAPLLNWEPTEVLSTFGRSRCMAAGAWTTQGLPTLSTRWVNRCDGGEIMIHKVEVDKDGKLASQELVSEKTSANTEQWIPLPIEAPKPMELAWCYTDRTDKGAVLVVGRYLPETGITWMRYPFLEVGTPVAGAVDKGGRLHIISLQRGEEWVDVLEVMLPGGADHPAPAGQK